MKVYFDNAATTMVIPEVRDIMIKTMEQDYGNPSSMHNMGVDAEKYLRYSRDVICRQLKCDSKELIFTSGGTESNNLALIGIAMANQRSGKHIITTRIEHASVYNPLLYLQDIGFEISFLDVDDKGIVDTEKLRQLLREDTILVSVMAVNNEIGSVQPVEEIGSIIKNHNSLHGDRITFHIDAVQAFGKLYIYPKRIGAGALSISGHKIHGSKGSGALFVDSKVKIKPIIYGGGQEKGRRSGTENTSAIAGLGKAAEIAYGNIDNNVAKMTAVKKRLIEGAREIDGIIDNSGTAPHIANISFTGVRSEVLLHALEDRGIYVSSGSACSSNHSAVSGVLKAIGLGEEGLDSALRFSFSEFNTEEEAEYVVDALKELVPNLRRFKRR